MQEQTISEFQKKMISGELTSRQLTELFLERINSVDHNGPKLNSVIETNPATLAAEIYISYMGVDYIRTHDVRALSDALKVLGMLNC